MNKLKSVLSQVPFVLVSLVVLILVPTLLFQYFTYQAVVTKPICNVQPATVVTEEVTPTPTEEPTVTPVPARGQPVSTQSAN